MPPTIQIRGRNKAPVPDGMPGFGGGQVSNLRPSLLQPNQSEQLLNIDLVRLEDATTRRGCDQLESGEAAGANPVLGLAYYDIGGNKKLVRVKNVGMAVKVQTHDGTPASSWTDAAGWTPAAADCAIVQGNNKLFFGNGTDNLRSWDGAAFTDMGTGYPNPPRYANLLHATNRLIGWGDTSNPDTIGFSNILGEGVWSLANTLRPGAGDGNALTCCLLWSKNLLVAFKRSATYLINIDPALTVANMVIDTVSESIGCVGPRAACKVGSDIWFMTDDGIRSLRRVLNGEDTEVVPPLTFPVEDLLDDRNRAALSTTCCLYFNDRFLLGFPTEENERPNRVLTARVLADGVRWQGEWTGWAPCIFVRSLIDGVKRLNIGRSDGLVWRWREFVPEIEEAASDYQDAGTDYASEILTRRMNFGAAEQWKQGFTIEAEFNESTAEVAIYAVVDGVEDADPLLTASSALGFLTFPLTFPIVFPAVGIKRAPGTLMHTDRFRDIAFRIAAESGKMTLRQIGATAFLQKMEIRSQ
jgi:hypothetical protein